MSAHADPYVEAILLAAGESSRMGSPKPLIEWEGEPLVCYQIGQLLRAGVTRVTVVVGHAERDVRAAIAGCDHPAGAVTVVANSLYRTSKASSVRVGAEALSGRATGILVIAVDQPRPAELIARMISAHGTAPSRIIVPVHGGRRGHPVLFPSDLVGELARVDDETLGIRAALARHDREVLELAVASRAVLLDINDAASLTAARTAWQAEIVQGASHPVLES